MSYNHCRFCTNWKDQGLVKYGPRHYAHYRCFLERGKNLASLPSWQLGEFPYRLLREFNVTNDRNEFVDPALQAKFEAAQVPFRGLRD